MTNDRRRTGRRRAGSGRGRPNDCGFTVLEALIGAALFSIVMLGAGTFYVFATREEGEVTSQRYMQDRATLVFDELTRQIQGACSCIGAACAAPCAQMAITTCSGIANSLQVTKPNGDVYCFRQDVAGTGLFEDIVPAGGGSGGADLLSGGPVTLTTTTGACTGGTPTGGFCPTVAGGVATITLRLRYKHLEGDSYQTMTFKTSIAPRNGN